MLTTLAMKVAYDAKVVPNPLLVLRQAGYAPFRDPVTGDESFIIRLTTEYYPRFHLYVEEKGDEVIFSLHLDQKKPSYGSGPAHGGEYEGPTVEREMRRIDSWVQATKDEMADEPEKPHVSHAKEKSWWKKLFG